jgi:serine/threonine-protein kinase
VARGASGPRQIYLRPLDTLESQAVAGTEGAEGPVLSPDGRWLVFFADGALKKVPLTGGVAEVLADATTGVKGAVWTNDRTVVFAPYASGLQEVPVSAGTPRPVSKFQSGETLHLWPAMLPSHRVLFAVFSIGGQTAFVSQALDGSARRDVLRAVGSMPVFVPPGHLLYAQNGTLMAVPFDADAESPRGDVPAQPVVKGVWEGGFTAQFAVSPSGTLAFAPGPVVATPTQLVLVDRDGTAHPLRAAPGFFNQPRLSPDGKHLLVDNVGAGDAMQVWSYDIAQDRMGPFTYGGVHRHAIWTADSRRVIFMSTGGGSSRIMWQAADGTGSPETLVNESDAAGVLTIPYAASSGVLTFTKLFPTKATELWAIPLPGQAPPASAPSVPAKPLLETRTADGAAELSPDGHWLAYASDDDGHGREVFVRAYPGPGGPWQVSSGGGNEPKWNPKGGEIFYRQGTRMMAVDVATGPGFSAGKPRQLFDGDYVPTFGGYVRANYDVSSDGKSFLMLQPVTKERTLPTEIELVVNWSEELKRLLP